MKERVYFDLAKVDPEVREKVLKVVELANQKEKGDEVDLRTILNYSVKLIKESHVSEIKKESLSEWDLIKLEFENYQSSSEDNISLPKYILKRFKKEIKS